VGRANIVVDTNVFLSAAINPDGLSAEALYRALEEYQLLHSTQTLEELVTRLNSGKICKYSTEKSRNTITSDVEQASKIVEVEHRTTACRDPKDNKFLELAVSGEAKYILSGDKDLLDMGQCQGIEILSPRGFLEAGTGSGGWPQGGGMIQPKKLTGRVAGGFIGAWHYCLDPLFGNARGFSMPFSRKYTQSVLLHYR